MDMTCTDEQTTCAAQAGRACAPPAQSARARALEHMRAAALHMKEASVALFFAPDAEHVSDDESWAASALTRRLESLVAANERAAVNL